MKKLNTKNITKIINNYPTKHKEGFTEEELNSLIKEYNLDSEKFYTSLGINTCIIKEGEVLTYHYDIETTLHSMLENRDKYPWEWD